MTAAINYASSPLAPCAVLSTGDTSRTAPTTVANLLVASGAAVPAINAASGAQIERVTIQPLAATTATCVRLWLHDGTNYHLRAEFGVAATGTVTGSNPIPSQQFEAVDNPSQFPIIMPAGWSLRASINDTQAGGVNVFVEGGGF